MALDCHWRCDVCNEKVQASGPYDPPEGWERRRIQSIVMGADRNEPGSYGRQRKESGCEFVLCPECQKRYPADVIAGARV